MEINGSRVILFFYFFKFSCTVLTNSTLLNFCFSIVTFLSPLSMYCMTCVEPGLHPRGPDRSAGRRHGGRGVPDGAEGSHEPPGQRDTLYGGNIP